MPGVPDAAAWEVFGQLAAVLIFLATLVGAVWKFWPHKRAPASDADLAARIASIEQTLEKDYISRSDWVPIASRMMGMMERNTEMLARLDERTRK